MDGEEFAKRALLTQNKTKLAWAEGQITMAVNTIGKMLKEIHDKSYWNNGEYQSFEDYCLKKWSIGKSRSYQILSGENTRLMLADAVEGETRQAVETMNESQLRQISTLPIAERIEAVKASVVNGKVSTAKLRERLPQKPLMKHVCPECGHTF
jgi:rubrerythrin